MIDPAHLSVLLRVPEHIRRGLIDGTLTAWGGTVRDAQGHIRALLVEGRGLGELIRQGTPLDLKVLTDAIGHAHTAAQMAAGLSALNLGVSVAGFAMIQQRLDRLSEQLNEALLGLVEVKDEARWISSLQIATLRADVDSACDLAIRAYRTSDLLLFKEARGVAHRARRVLHHTMTLMLEAERSIARHAIFGEFVQASAVLAVVEARSDEVIEGSGQAAKTLEKAADDLRSLVAKFDTQVRDVRIGFKERLNGGDDLRARLMSLRREMHTVVQQVDGSVLRLRFKDALGLSNDEWVRWTALERSDVVACIVARSEQDRDLIEVAREDRCDRQRGPTAA